jgi:hypothetical protein
VPRVHGGAVTKPVDLDSTYRLLQRDDSVTEVPLTPHLWQTIGTR